jgi:hypothetical protein
MATIVTGDARDEYTALELFQMVRKRRTGNVPLLGKLIENQNVGFMIDQSGSMADTFGTESALRKADFVADVVNRAVHDLVIRCTRTEEIRNYYYVSVIGYGGTVGPGFGGSLSGRMERFTQWPSASIGFYLLRSLSLL